MPRINNTSVRILGNPQFTLTTYQFGQSDTNTQFIYHNQAPSHDNVCCICFESMSKGMPAVLPACEKCHSGNKKTPCGLSQMGHVHCFRKLFNCNIPQNDRDPNIKHLICQRTYHTRLPVPFLYHVPEKWVQHYDSQDISPGKCECCGFHFDTRSALSLHMNQERELYWPWIYSYMSPRETFLWEHHKNLFMCPNTFVMCRYCAVFNPRMKNKEHEKLCGRLSESERQLIKKFNTDVERGMKTNMQQYKKNLEEILDAYNIHNQSNQNDQNDQNGQENQ